MFENLRVLRIFFFSEVRIDDQLLSPLRIGALEFKVGEPVTVGVELIVKQCVPGIEDLSGVISISTCQDCDNLRCSPDISHQVAVLGCPSLVVSKVSRRIC